VNSATNTHTQKHADLAGTARPTAASPSCAGLPGPFLMLPPPRPGGRGATPALRGRDAADPSSPARREADHPWHSLTRPRHRPPRLPAYPRARTSGARCARPGPLTGGREIREEALFISYAAGRRRRLNEHLGRHRRPGRPAAHHRSAPDRALLRGESTARPQSGLELRVNGCSGVVRAARTRSPAVSATVCHGEKKASADRGWWAGPNSGAVHACRPSSSPRVGGTSRHPRLFHGGSAPTRTGDARLGRCSALEARTETRRDQPLRAGWRDRPPAREPGPAASSPRPGSRPGRGVTRATSERAHAARQSSA
jgi:hypothetical protein